MTDTAIQVLARSIDTAMPEPLRDKLIGRGLVTVSPLSKGDDVFEVEAYSYDDLSDDATVDYELPDPDASGDEINTTRTVVKVPVFSKGFRIRRSTYEIFKARGTPIDTTTALSAAYIVGKKEDAAILQGWAPDGTNYRTNGLYRSAGNQFSTPKDFGTYGYATDAVGGAIAMIEDDDAEANAYNLTLNPIQRGELRVSRSANGVLEEPDIMGILNPNGGSVGRIWTSKRITAGTGLITPVDPARQYIELHTPRDYRTSLGVNSKDEANSPIYGKITCMTYLNVKHANAIAALTSI